MVINSFMVSFFLHKSTIVNKFAFAAEYGARSEEED